MFFVLFPKKSLFRDNGLSVQSTVLMIEFNCPLRIIINFSTSDNNFATKAVLEKCVQTVKVLLVETECVQFL